MAATIQTIEIPKRWRAQDTSSSYQNISQNYIVNGTFDSTADADDDWTKVGGGIAIGSGKLTWTTDGENQAAISKAVLWDADSMAGKTVRLKYQVVTNSDNINFYTGGYSTSGIFDDMVSLTKTVGYHERILTIRSDVTESSGQKLYLHVNHTAGQTFEIDNVELYEVEPFGNNNHGQIYSGRGLEFDGVTDYLSTGYNAKTDGITNYFTASCWLNTNSFSTNQFPISFYANAANGLNLRINTSGNIHIYDDIDNNDEERYETAIQLNTWYRAVMVMDNLELKLYLNGQLIGSGTNVSDGLDSFESALLVGARSTAVGNEYWFSGMMSDFQVWNAAWTADDVAFDYANPEQLALNRGGTSLTESNLKLWYPMNDGHRGQQSYVLDASNTGLGDELITNGDFSSWSGDDPNNWTVAGESGDRKVTQGTLNNGNSCRITQDPSDATNVYIQGPNLTSGVTYRFSFELLEVSRGAIQIDHDGNSQIVDTTIGTKDIATVGTHVGYFTATANASINIARGTTGTDATFTNVSVKPVNDKNHATTVFYGDEMVANGDMNVIDPTTITIGGVAAAEDDGTMDDSTAITDHTSTDTNNKTLKITGDSSSQYPKVKWLDGSNMGMVAGRTYYIEAYVYLPSANPNIDRVQLAVLYNGGGSSDTDTVTATDAWTKVNKTIVDDDIQDIRILGYEDGASAKDLTGDVFYIDSLSVKEVGTATGWTDADQQLDIPQTALQSYNQLAWFDGAADYVSVADHSDFTFGDGSSDDAFSISAWINMNEATDFPVVGKFTSSHREYILTTDSSDKLFFKLYDNSESTYILALYDTALTSFEGEWLHIVATYDATEHPDGISLYINGESLTTVVTDSGTYVATEDKDGVFAIGANLGDSKYANGCITEVSVWDSELTQTEVNELYNDGKALDAMVFSRTVADLGACLGYWRNKGLATWSSDKTGSSRDGTPTSLTETILQQAGVDASRDCQGFLMNRQKDTNALNLHHTGDTTNDLDNKTYVGISDNPLGTSYISVNNKPFSVSLWLKPHRAESTSQHTAFFLGDSATSLFSIGVQTGKDLCVSYDADNATKPSINNVIPDGEWTHVVVCCNSGFHTGADDQHGDTGEPMVDSAASFDVDELIDGLIHNCSDDGGDGSWGKITDNTTTTVTSKGIDDGTLETGTAGLSFDGGTDGEWDTNDNYNVVKIYINGEADIPDRNDDGGNPATMDSSNKYYIGTDDSLSRQYAGEVDEIMVYDKWLTAAEVKRNYNAGKRSHR